MMSNKTTQSEKNLYLVGFMGVGKSHFGRLVASELDFQFLDSDHEISKNEKRSIPEIFEKYGEPYFRKLEHSFIESGHPNSGCVVACGGGLAVQGGMMDVLKSKGVVVALFASKEEILERILKNKNRPLLNVENPKEKIENLLEERSPIYLESDVSIATQGRNIQEVSNGIIRSYKKILSRKRA